MSDTLATANSSAMGTRRLAVEFLTLFLMAPLLMAVFLPPRWMFPMLFALTALGIVLLHTTSGFRWRTLFYGATRISWTLIALLAGATAMAGYFIIMKTRPEALFFVARQNAELMLMIAIGYPFVSALPQELVFRPLFFQRYHLFLPKRAWLSVPLNAAIFSLAHLMYWSWVVAIMTFLGGLVFATSYRVRGNFAEAVVAHAVAGVVVFAMGLGVYFYSGNVTRPF